MNGFTGGGGELGLTGADLTLLIRDVLARGASFRFLARGSSMWPFILEGDVVTLSPLNGEPPRIGEVVAFSHPRAKGLCIHRIVEIRGEKYLIGGDNNRRPDGVFAISDLLGRVTRVERNGKTLSFGLGPEKRWIPWLRRWGISRWLHSRAVKTVYHLYRRVRE